MTSNTMSQQTRVPRTMQAIHLPSSFTNQPTPGGPASLKYETDRPVPIPARNQYLIKVQAVCVAINECESSASSSSSTAAATSSSSGRSTNPRDSGMYLQQPPTADGIDKTHGLIPGREFCGEIITTPVEDYSSPTGPAFKVGDEVIGLLASTAGKEGEEEEEGKRRDGAAADYVLATESELAWKPRNLSAAEAATIPLDALIAWQGLFGYATLDPDDGPCNKPADGPLRVLVTNAAQSELGKQVMRLLRCQALFPCNVPNLMGGGAQRETSVWICATGSRDEHDYLRSKGLGAADAVTANADIAAAFRENGWEPVDIVFDCIGAGGASWREAHSPVVVKDGGHVLTPSRVPSAHPQKPSEWDERTETMNRNLTSAVVDVKPNARQLAKIAQLAEQGVLKPAESYLVENLLQGQQALVHAQRAGKQKVVLRVDPSLSEI